MYNAYYQKVFKVVFFYVDFSKLAKNDQILKICLKIPGLMCNSYKDRTLEYVFNFFIAKAKTKFSYENI